jgi:hypothetical protein
MKDIYNNITKSDLLVQFTTSSETYSPGKVIDNFDANTNGWMQPKQSAVSLLFDTAKTSLLFVSEKYRGGTGAAKLSYQFSGNAGGVIELKNSGAPLLDLAGTFGLWIFGDASNNSLELHFSPNEQSLIVGNIFWRGWKFVQYPVSSINGPNRTLTSIVIKQSNSAVAEHKLYFDELQTDAGVLNIRRSQLGYSAEYALGQNYPNPFNPSTEISYSIATPGFITVKVYDVLGREASVLVDEFQQAGRYTIPFDASRLSSGMYFYTLQGNSFTQTKKMIFAK